MRIVKAAGRAALVLAALFAATPSAHATDPLEPDDELVDSARGAAMELGRKLKAELERVLKADGPHSALGICNTVAPEIAQDLSASFGGTVGRTALKVRNPANAADAFEEAVLQRFVDEAERGADVSKLEHAEIVEAGGKRTFRYMKAIPMAATPCSACHGAAVAPDLLQTIRELYPSDQAVGFSAGDIRGAFTVAKPLP